MHGNRKYGSIETAFGPAGSPMSPSQSVGPPAAVPRRSPSMDHSPYSSVESRTTPVAPAAVSQNMPRWNGVRHAFTSYNSWFWATARPGTPANALGYAPPVPPTLKWKYPSLHPPVPLPIHAPGRGV